MSCLRSSWVVMVVLVLSGCAVTTGDVPSESGPTDTNEGELARSATDHWFYGGPLPTLEDGRVTLSLEGHTARMSGLLPEGASLGEVPPHVKLTREGNRTRLDAVYPIATARAGKSDARPGSYRFNNVIPYRPDGIAVTAVEGAHMVTWGGFPFLRYNGGIAMHGPITSMDNKSTDDVSVWYLQRGDVSGGCNRMMGEHVVELAHMAGISMRRVYTKNAQVTPPGLARVTVISGYDTYGGKYVDVDFPTDAGVARSTATRPAKIYGAENVEMFGSWIASTMPNGRDLPPDLKWEGGVAGAYYVFAEHTAKDWVCAVPASRLSRLKAYVASSGELPASFCVKKTCVLDALDAGKDPKGTCGL